MPSDLTISQNICVSEARLQKYVQTARRRFLARFSIMLGLGDIPILQTLVLVLKGTKRSRVTDTFQMMNMLLFGHVRIRLCKMRWTWHCVQASARLMC